jgi:hypothetical protein
VRIATELDTTHAVGYDNDGLAARRRARRRRAAPRPST